MNQTDMTRVSVPETPSFLWLVVELQEFVQQESRYAVLETLAAIVTLARKSAGGTLPKLL